MAPRIRLWQVMVGGVVVGVGAVVTLIVGTVAIIGLLFAVSGTPRPAYRAPITPPPETPTPGPSPWSSGWPYYGDDNSAITRALFDACYRGAPVPGAAPYAGETHPLIVEDMSGHWGGFDINANFPWDPWSWPSPIQLVVCVHSDEKKVGSCGLYKNESGEVGELLRYDDMAAVRVVIAETGETLQSEVLTNPAPKCPKMATIDWGIWELRDRVTDAQITDYATAVSKQTVK